MNITSSPLARVTSDRRWMPPSGSGSAKSAARQPKGRSWLEGAAIDSGRQPRPRRERRLDDADHLRALGALEHEARRTPSEDSLIATSVGSSARSLNIAGVTSTR